VAKASIGAAEEFPEGKPYRVDAGPNTARKRARDTMAPLNNKNTNIHVPTNSPQGIPHSGY